MLYKKTNPHGGAAWEPGVTLDLSANVNPLGTPPGVIAAATASLSRVYDYPDPCCRDLVRAIAAYEGVPEDYVLCGCGAAELIYAYAEALRPRTAAETAPTFSEYALGLEKAGCAVTRYPLRQEEGFLLGEGFLDFLREKRPEAVYLCTPNNPTGRLIPRGLLERVLELCAGLGTRLFLDECFLALSEGGESMKDRLPDYPGLFLLKAFTKSYGMAGLRLGYCLTADASLLEKMSEMSQPWNVSLPAQAAGIAALGERDFLERAREIISAQRPRLKAGLEALGLWVCPSEANYLLFKGPPDLGERLLGEGVALRSCGNYHGLGPGWFRTAVKTEKENQTLLETLRRIGVE